MKTWIHAIATGLFFTLILATATVCGQAGGIRVIQGLAVCLLLMTVWVLVTVALETLPLPHRRHRQQHTKKQQSSYLLKGDK